MDIKAYKWGLVHRSGCGKIALYFFKRPVPGELLHASNCHQTTGPCINNTQVFCQVCHRLVMEDDLISTNLAEL